MNRSLCLILVACCAVLNAPAFMNGDGLSGGVNCSSSGLIHDNNCPQINPPLPCNLQYTTCITDHGWATAVCVVDDYVHGSGCAVNVYRCGSTRDKKHVWPCTEIDLGC